MKCSACGVDNAAGRKFCGECGAELRGVTELRGYGVKATTSGTDLKPLTPNPGTPNPLSYTPKHLAEKILTSRSALEGERKQVTVLFADVKGSMELAEQLDRFLRFAAEDNTPEAFAYMFAWLAEAYYHMHEPDKAFASAVRSQQSSRSAGDPPVMAGYSQTALAYAHLAAGRPWTPSNRRAW
jgi:hypothetical protein